MRDITTLRQARENTGLKRSFVANKLGITGDYLNVLERGKFDLDLTKIKKLSKLYNISITEMGKIVSETRKEYK